MAVKHIYIVTIMMFKGMSQRKYGNIKSKNTTKKQQRNRMYLYCDTDFVHHE